MIISIEESLNVIEKQTDLFKEIDKILNYDYPEMVCLFSLLRLMKNKKLPDELCTSENWKEVINHIMSMKITSVEISIISNNYCEVNNFSPDAVCHATLELEIFKESIFHKKLNQYYPPI